MNKQDIIYLGSLLHDIGKFVYRAQPTQAGGDHETLGEMFTREFIATKFDCLVPHEKEIISAANRRRKNIKLADMITAQERKSEESQETRRPLYSIFKYVDIGLDNNYINDDYIYYLEPLPLEKSHNFPERKELKSENWMPDESVFIELHSSSLEKFKKELTEISQNSNTKDLASVLKTLYTLLWKYTSTVSSASYRSEPDISLFDHSRTVAAVAVCLQNAENLDVPVIVLKGDVSGIQKFIYSEIKDTDKAAKKLRGRSFFLKLLTDTICDYIIRSFKLYDANIIYNSGGSFEILIPANPKNNTQIEELEKQINLTLFKMFGAELQIVLAWGEHQAELLFTSYNEIQSELTTKLSSKKRKKSLSILENIFPPKIELEDRRYDESKIKFEELGTKIPHSEYLLEIIGSKISENPDLDIKNSINLAEFETSWILVENRKNLEIALSDLKEISPDQVIIYNLKNTSISEIAKIATNFSELPIAYSFKFIANNAPVDKNNQYKLLEFSEIAKIEAGNYPLLGVLRMDVDNLGFIFKQGMKSQSYSISRLASLSRQLDMFFTRDIDLIAKEHNIYITYSGGDDLFAIGSWVKIIDFAQEVRNKFREYTSDNGNITLSGGVVLTKSSYPIAKSAQLSGIEESKAKKSITKSEPNGSKDKISIFDVQIRWNELKDKIDIAKKLCELTVNLNNTPKGISTSLIYRLLSYVKQTFRNDGTMDLNMVHLLSSKLAYLFARRDITEEKIDISHNHIESSDLQKKEKEIKKTLLNYFLWKPENEKKKWYRTFPIIGNYVILKNRKQKTETN